MRGLECVLLLYVVACVFYDELLVLCICELRTTMDAKFIFII